MAASVLLVVTPRAAVAELPAGLGLSVLVTSAGAERLRPAAGRCRRPQGSPGRRVSLRRLHQHPQLSLP